MKTTIILTGYNINRLKNNKNIIFNTYDKLSEYIDQIIFIWNNQDISMPELPKTNNIKTTIIKPTINSICNRHHIAYNYILTDSVLIVDDDIVIDKVLIKDLINKWTNNKNNIIGYKGRSYDMYGNYQYKQFIYNTSLTIGQTMMYHKKYMLEFAKHKYLHKYFSNHDDIVFQIMVHSLNHKNCTKIVKTNGILQKLNSDEGVSSNPNWLKLRTNAVRKALKYFDKPLPIVLYYNRKNNK